MAKKAPAKNALYYGDNLNVLRDYVADESVDLVYLDPPFNSNADYNVLFREASGEQAQAQIKAFTDTWHWTEAAFSDFVSTCQLENAVAIVESLVKGLGRNDLTAYLVMMAPRLVELHRVLKPTGSLYLHCDPTASHYLKVLLDAIFGPVNFRNEIIWRRTGAHNSSKRYGPIHDTLLFYRKSDAAYFKTTYRPYLKGHVDGYFKQHDDRGRYWTNSIHGAGTRNGESGKAWKNYNPTAHGRHWAIPSKLIDELGIDPDLGVHEKLDALNELGLLDLPADATGLPTYRQYLHLSPGVPLQDLWTYQPHTRGSLHGSPEAIDEDVRWLVAQGDKERLGYPTQKPLGLLARIIASSCPEGGTVLDPFCGCGTTISAAQTLKRRWLGIDITHLAVALIKYRLRDAFPEMEEGDFEVHGEPTTEAEAMALAEQDRYEFQRWAISLIPRAFPYQEKKGADSGIDGLLRFQDDPRADVRKAVIQVKSGNLKASDVRDFAHVIAREEATLGLLITQTMPSKPMLIEAGKMGFYTSPLGDKKYPVFQIRTVGQLLEGKAFETPSHVAAVFSGIKKAERLDSSKQVEFGL